MEFIMKLILAPFVFIFELFYVIGYVLLLIGTLLRDNKGKISRQLKSKYGDRFKVESTKKRFGGVFVPIYEGETVTLSDKNGLSFVVFWKDNDFGDLEGSYSLRTQEIDEEDISASD
jgi:hypothetical protein